MPTTEPARKGRVRQGPDILADMDVPGGARTPTKEILVGEAHHASTARAVRQPEIVPAVAAAWFLSWRSLKPGQGPLKRYVPIDLDRRRHRVPGSSRAYLGNVGFILCER